MPDFGVTDAGYVLPTQQQLIALMVADEKATINPNCDTSSDSPLGQINGIVTRQLMIAYEGQQASYNGFDPDAVEGFQQTNLAKLTGTPRNDATQSQVTLTCDLDLGTTLLAGITLAAVFGNPSSQWTPLADYTAASGGPQPVVFVNVLTGPLEAPAGAIIVRTTTVVGWNSVTNALDATPGTDAESDPDLRSRREIELKGGGAGNVDAIRAALLKINDSVGPFVISAFMLNNTTDFTDANGVPPHSTEAIIWDGPGAPVSNDAIAQVLWDKGASGIRNFGTLSGTAIDALGNAHTVNFTRVTQILIGVAFATVARAGYVGDVQFKEQIAAVCNGDPAPVVTTDEQVGFGVGDDVDPYDVLMNTAKLGAQVIGLALFIGAPSGTPGTIAVTPLAIGPRQIGIFDSSRILVNGA
jgi:hypothetical protein